MKHKLSFFLSFVVGAAIFVYFLFRAGLETIVGLIGGVDLLYLALAMATFLPTFWIFAYRMQIIAKTHGKIVTFSQSFKSLMASYAVGYVTPIAKIGGEPLRAYMIHKECKMDLKNATSMVLLDKFIELGGAIFFGVLGLSLFAYLLGASAMAPSFIFGILMATFLWFVLFYRALRGRDTLSPVFKFFGAKQIAHDVRDVERKMSKFFVKHRKVFWKAFLLYVPYFAVLMVSTWFLMLAIGVQANAADVMLVLTIFGFANFMPTPGGLGFLEGGQAGLFSLLGKGGSAGFAFGLLMRIRDVLYVALGFVYASHFGGRHVSGEFAEEMDVHKIRSKRKVK